jgi:hypothetical protein
MDNPVLFACDFPLTGLQGDLAEAGKLFVSTQNKKLYLALDVETLMLESGEAMGEDLLDDPLFVSSVISHDAEESADSLEMGSLITN